MESKDELSKRYEVINKRIKFEEYYWEQKVKNFIKTGNYYK